MIKRDSNQWDDENAFLFKNIKQVVAGDQARLQHFCSSIINKPSFCIDKTYNTITLLKNHTCQEDTQADTHAVS